jgi:hypothetical protein
MLQAINASTTGTYLVGQGTLGIAGARLVAAAAAATATIRETDGSGRILAVLSAPVEGADEWGPAAPVAYHGQVHVTVAGAGAQVFLYA